MQEFNNSNITFEAMDDEIVNSSPNKQKESAFNEKNYLNVKLGKNESSKDLRIRLLPINSQSQTPFKKIFVHTIKVSKDISPNGWKSYICLEHTEGIDKEKYGKKCPFCELNREAYKHFTEETDAIAKERWKKISLDNKPKEACIVRCIERGAEEDGPKFWKFNTRKDKGDPKGQILELYKTRLAESKEEGLGDENILDIRTGKDLKVTISTAADNRASVKVVDYGKNKPLSEDESEIAKWINDSKEWHDVFAVKPYDYLKIILDGEVPFFDKAANRWVSRVEHNAQNEEMVDEYEAMIEEAENEVLSFESATQSAITEDFTDELPY